MRAIYWRELRSYITTPIGYVFAGMFLAVSGALFSFLVLLQADTSSMSSYFLALLFVFAILIPLLTMKLFADDRRTKAEQILLTAPVSLTSMVLAKYLAALTVFAAVLGVNSFNFYLLYLYGNPSLSYILLNVLSLFLIGAAFIAVGVFISALTESQLNAAIGSMGIIVVLLILGLLVSSIPVEWVRTVIRWFSIIDRYATMANGILDLSAVVYFISFTAVFLFLTVRVYEKRRWS